MSTIRIHKVDFDLNIVYFKNDETARTSVQGADGGNYMLASCNSICEGMNPPAVAEMFRYESEVGLY